MASAAHNDLRQGEVPALVALGSNLGDRAASIAAGVNALATLPGSRLLAASSVIETDPVGPQDQPAYFNAAALLATSLRPADLLASMLEIESAHGRVRDPARRWGPRTLDLDLILFGAAAIDEPGIRIPHPRMHERLFVLVPAAEIAPDMDVPGTGATISQVLERLRRKEPS